MKLLDVLTDQTILTDLQARDKITALSELLAPLCHANTPPREALIEVLLERERLGSTGIGNGIAIPHGKLEGIGDLILIFGKSRRGVSFDAMDNKPVHIFFVILTPAASTGLHLKVLARISRLLRDPAIRDALRRASSADMVRAAIAPMDEDF
ncbi:PTS sugar transporter subunit IIA [Desulfobotulus sp. H1]|uniref:PTS sugar transporter subunit IIA n=1 Tax=Desulfobotulus pelophilus TaxID=2823377 RepID=A0ABT3N703_9BACT|nr:PTS sugar transporter subunit IIA [Desulfobotulus pelophilus]MCW7752822.1 PTS sugar transporter subunit IIA [Desulfobotulus pelophilus]